MGMIELALKWTLPYITPTTSQHTPPPSQPHPHREEKVPKAIDSQESDKKGVHLLEREHPNTQEVRSTVSEKSQQTSQRKQKPGKDITPLISKDERQDAAPGEIMPPTATQSEGVAPVIPPSDRSDSESSVASAGARRRGPVGAQGKQRGTATRVKLKTTEARALPGLRKHPVVTLATSTAPGRMPAHSSDSESAISEVSTLSGLPVDTTDTENRATDLQSSKLRKSGETPVVVGSRPLLGVSDGAGERIEERVTPVASEQGDYADSVSVTATEYSDEGGEGGSEGEGEEEEETLSEEEDTMFEETLPQTQGTAGTWGEGGARFRHVYLVNRWFRGL